MFEGLFEPTHLILILAIILIVFGAGKLPEVGSGLGKSITEFRRGVREITDDPPVAERPTVATPTIAAPPVAESTSTCASCGSPIVDGDRFCAKCGSKLAA